MICPAFLCLEFAYENNVHKTGGITTYLHTYIHHLCLCVPSREMKMEKRSCSGIARVTPSSHMGPSTHPTSTAGKKAGCLC